MTSGRLYCFLKPNQSSLFNGSSQSLSFLQACAERLWGRDWVKELVMYMSTAEIRRLLEARKWALFRQIFRSLLASQVLRISRAPVHFKTIRCLAVMLLRCKRTVENLPGRKQTPLVDHKLSLQHYFLIDQTWCVFAVLTFANSPEEKLAI